MLWVRQGTHVIDHPRFLEAGVDGRDLWQWGMLYAGAHETDGELPTVAVLASAWGAGGKKNARLAEKLVQVGLWERTDSGFRICRWVEQGNQTKAQLTADREAARERKAKSGSGKVQANEQRTNARVPTSTSLSTSESGSGSQIASPPPTPVSPSPPAADGSPPAWFGQACEVIAMNTGVILPVAEAWLRYDGHRAGKGIAPTTKDAQYWLTTVMVPEARELLRRESRDKDRDKVFAGERAAKLGVAPKPEDSRKAFRERDDWAKTAGPPDPATAERMRKLMGGLGR